MFFPLIVLFQGDQLPITDASQPYYQPFSYPPQIRWRKQFHPFAKLRLGLTKLVFDDPEETLDLSPHLRFGVFNLEQCAANDAFPLTLATTAGLGGDRPDHLLLLMFRTLFHAAVARFSTDRGLFAMQQLIDLGNLSDLGKTLVGFQCVRCVIVRPAK